MHHIQSHPRTTKLLILLFLLIFSLFNSSLSKKCNPYDEKVLLEIKNELGNPTSLANWDPHYDCCQQWMSIECDGNGHVIQLTLNLGEYKATKVPSTLGRLTSLQSLLVYGSNTNNPSIRFPLAICDLTNLLVLAIGGPHFSGHIPSCIGQQLKNLTRLHIGSNPHITGPIPKSLGQLSSLTFLDLSSNNLSGKIPRSLGRLHRLEYINLGSNSLSYSIPVSLALIPNLSFLSLEENQLRGSIPKSFGSFQKNIVLRLGGNQLSGRIPKSLSRANANIMDFSRNNLIGDATILLGRKKGHIEAINLSKNRLVFNLSMVNSPLDLKEINISHNMIYGSFPRSWDRLHLESIDVSYNELCGPIPNGKRWKRFKPINFAHNKCLCGLPLPPCK